MMSSPFPEKVFHSTHSLETDQALLPSSGQISELQALFLEANRVDANMAQLENNLLAMDIPHGLRYFVGVLQDSNSSDRACQLATMCLIRHGEAAKNQVERFSLSATTERQLWMADFLTHQLGLKRPA
jgi:hypothetical protein